MEVLVAASMAVGVPLGVDILVLGNVDDVGLDLRWLRLLEFWCLSDSSGIDLVYCSARVRFGDGRWLCIGPWLRLRGVDRRRIIIARRSLSTAHVVLQVLLQSAGSGLDIIGQNVGDLGARSRIVAREDGTDRVSSRGSSGLTRLVAGLQIVAFLHGRAVAAQTIDVRNIEVVAKIVCFVPLHEIFQLSNVVALALLCFGNLDRDAGTVNRIAKVLLVDTTLLEDHHVLIATTSVLQNRPNVHVVRAAVDNLGVSLFGITRGHQLLGRWHVGLNRGCEHDGRSRSDGDELHV